MLKEEDYNSAVSLLGHSDGDAFQLQVHEFGTSYL